MAYVKQTWKYEGEVGAIPINPVNLNHMESGIEAAHDEKVDKVSGKGLSTNDYTDADKAKVAGMPKISYGTGNPSGGSNGDIYIKYEV